MNIQWISLDSTNPIFLISQIVVTIIIIIYFHNEFFPTRKEVIKEKFAAGNRKMIATLPIRRETMDIRANKQRNGPSRLPLNKYLQGTVPAIPIFASWPNAVLSVHTYQPLPLLPLNHYNNFPPYPIFSP